MAVSQTSWTSSSTRYKIIRHLGDVVSGALNICIFTYQVRSKLDDIKRQELERLRHLAMKQFEHDNGIDREHIKMPVHVEVGGETFEKEDLKKLILSTTRDLEEADK